MKNSVHFVSKAAATALACAALLLVAAPAAFAQEASTTFRKTPRDPFTKYKVPVRIVRRAAPLTPPPIEQRIAMYKALKATAMSLQQPAPKPTTAFLLEEVQVNGIFRTPRGYAAMIEATPIKLSYVVYPGEQFFNGQLVAIEENRLVFRQETKWTDGRRDVRVEMKPLRQPNAVEDAMTAGKGSSPEGASRKGKEDEAKSAPKGKDEEPAKAGSQ